MGDPSPDAEKFTVKGNDTRVVANVYMPKGKLNVTGGMGLCTMTGKFISEDIESNNYVTWNGYDCVIPPAPLIATGGNNTKAAINNAIVVDDARNGFNINVSPNPSSTDFRIQVKSTSEEPVSIRIFDVTGRTIKVINNVSANSFIKVGSELRRGSYFAEVQQGANRQTIKLLKME